MPSLGRERRAQEQVSRVWDAVVRGTASDSNGLDPSLIVIIHRLQAIGGQPHPDEEFANRLQAELMQAQAATLFAGLTRYRLLTTAANGRSAQPTLPQPMRWREAPRSRWVLAQLATAALVLVTLIGAYVAFGGPLRPGGRQEQSDFAPAEVRAPETALLPGVTTDAALMRATFEEMPPRQTVWIGLARVTLDPGAVESAGANTDTGVGPNMIVVESGRVTIEADGPVTVTRGVANPNATPSVAAPRTEVVLDVGDQVLAASGVTWRRRNDTPAPATFLAFQMANFGTEVMPPGVNYHDEDRFPAVTVITPPEAPVEALVRRLTLAPGAELPLHDLPGLQFFYVESGKLNLFRDASANNPLDNRATPQIVNIFTANNGTGSFGPNPEHAKLVNPGAEPLVMVVATVVSIEPATANTESATIPGIRDDTVLLHETFNEIPQEAHLWVGVQRDPLAPGVRWSQGTPETSGIGPMLYKVETGTVTLHADGPVKVTRAGDQTATVVDKDTDIVLEPGDVAYLRSGVVSEWRNEGTAPASMLASGITTPGPYPTIPQTAPIDASTSSPPRAPAELTVRRMTFEPGASLPNGAEPGLKLVAVESGTLTGIRATRSEPSIPIHTDQYRVGSWVDVNREDYILNELRNDGSEPLVLLMMTVTPVRPGALGPANATDNLPAELTADTVLMRGTFATVPPFASWEGIARATLAPGAVWTLGKSENDGEGPWLYRVEFGELTINADGPVSVTRAGADQPVTIPPGTDVVLRTGDQGFTPSGVTLRWRNDRQVPVVVLDAGITTYGYGDQPEGVSHNALVSRDVTSPKRPVDVTVRRVTLPTTAVLVLGDVPGLELLTIESGQVEVREVGDGATAANPLQTDAAGTSVAQVSAGSSFPGAIPARGAIRAVGPDPATVLLMTISEVNAPEAAPMS